MKVEEIIQKPTRGCWEEDKLHRTAFPLKSKSTVAPKNNICQQHLWTPSNIQFLPSPNIISIVLQRPDSNSSIIDADRRVRMREKKAINNIDEFGLYIKHG